MFVSINNHPILNYLLLGIAGLIAAGCATKAGNVVSDVPESAASVQQVQADPAAHKGAMIRWGGDIIRLHNKRRFTEVEILAKTLKENGMPQAKGEPDARFIAKIEGFLDPVDFKAGQRMTVQGEIVGIKKMNVGEYPYHYPVVDVAQYQRWAAPQPRRLVRFIPDPFFDPFYRPLRRYPYWW